jgi:hypothetical protein
LTKLLIQPRREQHQRDGQHHRGDHDVELVDHADGGDHRVDGEHHVQQQDLDDHGAEGDRLAAGGLLPIVAL